MAGLGGEDYGGYTDLGNYNSFTPGLSRSGWYQAGTEGLFYYNMLGDDFVPWLATDYQYNADYTQLTVHIRPGVEWSDGQPFTAKDVAFTLMLLKSHPEGGWRAIPHWRWPRASATRRSTRPPRSVARLLSW